MLSLYKPLKNRPQQTLLKCVIANLIISYTNFAQISTHYFRFKLQPKLVKIHIISKYRQL